MGRCLLRNALIALAMVIGADIKDSVVLTVIPPYEFVVLLDEREESCTLPLAAVPVLNLGKKP